MILKQHLISLLPPVLRPVGVSGLILLLGAVPVAAEDLQKEGSFAANWSAAGESETLVLDEIRAVTTIRSRGVVVTESDQGFVRALQTDCIGINIRDVEANGTGRCVWIDSDDDRVVSEIVGALSDAMATVRGTFLGGTGKYAGLTGEYELSWQSLLTIEEEGTIHGYSTSMIGTWRLP